VVAEEKAVLLEELGPEPMLAAAKDGEQCRQPESRGTDRALGRPRPMLQRA
jgi:hypothetical protein